MAVAALPFLLVSATISGTIVVHDHGHGLHVHHVEAPDAHRARELHGHWHTETPCGHAHDDHHHHGDAHGPSPTAPPEPCTPGRGDSECLVLVIDALDFARLPAPRGLARPTATIVFRERPAPFLLTVSSERETGVPAAREPGWLPKPLAASTVLLL